MPLHRLIQASLTEAQSAVSALIANEHAIAEIAKAGVLLSACLENKGRVFSCGNGGSMCDAMHFAEELSGRYRKNRAALAATSISDPGHLSCVANDYGYEYVFSRYLEGHGRAGDCLVVLSTSGKSPSILKACEVAQRIGMKVIGLHGRPGSPLEDCTDVNICTQAGEFADRVQELHIKVLHILIELVERHLFPQNYA